MQAEIQHSRLQAEQVGDVAFDRQRFNGRAVESVAHGGVGGVQRRRLAADADRGRRRFYRHREVQRGGLIDEQLKRFRLPGESGSLDRDGVVAGRNLLKLISAAGVGGVVQGKTVFTVDQRNLSGGDR